MPTQCNAEQLQFSCVERRRVVAGFDGGRSARMAGRCCSVGPMRRSDDRSAPDVLSMSAIRVDRTRGQDADRQRVFGMALGYEDLNDHESLRTIGVRHAVGKLEPKRRARLRGAGRQEHAEPLGTARVGGSSRYHKVRPRRAGDERLWVDLYLDAHRRAPRRSFRSGRDR